MNGAILGDIAGSRFEFSKPDNFNSRTVRLFENNCFYTDDTVMTVATKYAVLNQIPYHKAYVLFGKKYPYAGYGTMFQQWINDYSHEPYHSFGNGSAMRVSFIGEYFDSLETVRQQAKKSAMCTHNHPEGIEGAEAVASCVYLGRNGYSKREIKKYIQKNFSYNLHPTLGIRRPFSKFDITCKGTVPMAIRCFLESDCWEECIRNVLSVTCDTDTVGCIAGGIAEAYYHKTGFDEGELLKKYLAKPSMSGRVQRLLYDWAIA